MSKVITASRNKRMERKLKMIRKAATCVLAAVVLSTTTGCLPAPFEQDIPSTSWQVDEKGNRIKVTNPGNGMTAEDIAAEKKAVKEALDNYYAAVKDEKVLAEMKQYMESTKSFKPSSDPEVLEKQESEMAQKALPFLAPVLETIDTTGLSEIEQVTLASGSVMFGGMGLKEMEIKIPDTIIIVTGETATIDMSKAEMYFQGEKTTSVAAKDGKSITHFVKKDGKWLINGKKLAESMGVSGSSMKISIGAE